MKKLIVLCIVALYVFSLQRKNIEATSPDGKNKISIDTKDGISYSIFRGGTRILDRSFLSLTVGKEVWEYLSHRFQKRNQHRYVPVSYRLCF